MPRPNKAYERLNEAALILIDLCGHEGYLGWLIEEAERTRVYLQARHNLTFPETAVVTAPMVDVAHLQAKIVNLGTVNQKLTEAVTWYADDLNWRAPRDKAKQSPAMADKGTIAQQALDEIEGRGEDKGEGSDD